MSQIDRPIVHRFSDGDAVATGIADAWVKKIAELLATKSEIHLQITGGTLGILMLAKAAEHPDIKSIDFDRVNFWWGDERFVDSDSKDRNANQAAAALLDKIDATRVHEFPAADEGLDLDDAAQEFADHVDLVKPHFDLTILGMGPDGHVASLFPGKPLPSAGLKIIAEHDSPKPPPQRLSFTYEAINNSTEIWLVVAGADKAEAASVAFSDAPTRLPVGRVHALGKTVWYLDQTAGEGI